MLIGKRKSQSKKKQKPTATRKSTERTPPGGGNLWCSEVSSASEKFFKVKIRRIYLWGRPIRKPNRKNHQVQEKAPKEPHREEETSGVWVCGAVQWYSLFIRGTNRSKYKEARL
jgi:hypothetical protein